METFCAFSAPTSHALCLLILFMTDDAHAVICEMVYRDIFLSLQCNYA